MVYSEDEIHQCTEQHEKEEEMREMIGIEASRWVPGAEHLERARSVAAMIKDGLLQHSSTEIEKTAVLEHFPFDDHDEGA